MPDKNIWHAAYQEKTSGLIYRLVAFMAYNQCHLNDAFWIFHCSYRDNTELNVIFEISFTCANLTS